MTAIDLEPLEGRTRGSAKLLDAWRTRTPGDEMPPSSDAQFWAESLRMHGGRPRPPRLSIDGTVARGTRV